MSFGCSQDRPSEEVDDLPPVTAVLAISSNSCPGQHPSSRDDRRSGGHAGVGITSTNTKTLDGFIPTGDAPTGVGFSPDGGFVKFVR